MRERLKEPRKGSEIEPETIYLQEVGAAASHCIRCASSSSYKFVKLKVHGITIIVNTLYFINLKNFITFYLPTSSVARCGGDGVPFVE